MVVGGQAAGAVRAREHATRITRGGLNNKNNNELLTKSLYVYICIGVVVGGQAAGAVRAREHATRIARGGLYTNKQTTELLTNLLTK